MPNLEAIATDYERRMLQTFNAIVSDIKDQAVLNEIARALDNGNVDAVIELLGLDEATWSPLADEIQAAYTQGGITGAVQIGPIPVNAGTLALRFNARSYDAEQWIKTQSSRLITEIVEDQRQLVRERLQEGLEKGRAPRQTALDLIGRINPQTKKREGGFIGLTSQQAQWVANARDELENLNPNYLTRKLRDKRLDRAIQKAIETGQPLPQKTIDAAINRLQQRTLKYRGDVIARTESIAALKAGQFESIAQAVIRGDVQLDEVTKAWVDTGDGRVRQDHMNAALQYENDPIPLQQPFIVGGERLMFPSDPNGTPKQTIQCRCRADYAIDFGKKLARVEGFE